MSVNTIQLSFPACFWLCYLLLQPWPGSKESGTDKTEFNPCKLVSHASPQKEAGSKWYYTAAVGAILLIRAPFRQEMSLVSNGRGTDRWGKSNPPLLLLMIPAKLAVNTSSRSLSALIDSGAEQSFIDHSLAQSLEILLEPLECFATHCPW